MIEPTKRPQKIFAGGKIRQLRHERNLSQARMAADLGISPSYQNLIERNQRPISAQVLLRLAEVYAIDLREFASTGAGSAIADLRDAIRNPLLGHIEIPEREIQEASASCPGLVQAFVTLYRSYLDNLESVAPGATDADAASQAGRTMPVEEVRDYFHDSLNHFPALEQAAEEFLAGQATDPDDPFAVFRRVLNDRHGVAVRVVPVEVLGRALRRYDYHHRTVYLSEALDQARRTFQLAYQLALFEARDPIDRLVADAALGSDDARAICRIGLTSYVAGALMMPYDRFRSAAAEVAYDIETLCRRFGASFEQVCHRLTTLQRPGAKGIPFFMIRVDMAGNVTKRFSATSLSFARQGGSCARWIVHATFQTPGRLLTQLTEMPDGSRYFAIARTVTRPSLERNQPPQYQAVALGCEEQYARRLVYYAEPAGKEPAPAIPGGVNCRMCDRAACSYRAFAPINRRLALSDNVREVSAYRFSER